MKETLQNTNFPANPDQVGYPEEQDDWYKYVEADRKYQFEQEQQDNEQEGEAA